MTVPPNIAIPPDALEAFCPKWRVRELSLIDSVMCGDFGPNSDVDVLVSFDEDAPWSLWDLIAMQDELAELFGRRVDLVEKEDLRNPFRCRRILEARQGIHGGKRG